MINPRIETFLTVCKHMNYTKAAEELHITQPSVSQQIRHLEEYYRTELFSRQGKKIFLTPSGEILLRAAETMRNDEIRLFEKISDEKRHNTSLVFGATMTIAEFALSAPLNRIIKTNPDFDIHMIMGNTAQLIDKLRCGDIHFAIVEGYFNSSDFEKMLFKREKYIPVCASNHKFKKRPSSLSDLLEESVLIREKGSGTREILEKKLDLHSLSIDSFAKTIEIGSMQTLIQLLLTDNGISFLYEAAVSPEIGKGTLVEIELDDFNVFHDFNFIWNKDSSFSDEYRDVCTRFIG